MLVRTTGLGSQGYQVLLDHRRSGGIGGIFGNGIGGFHAVGFTIDVARDPSGRPTGLKMDDPATTVEPFSEDKRALLRYAATLEEFLSTWKWDDWNRFRILCVGEHPVISVWINDVLISECDTSALPESVYDKAAVKQLLGDRGHIALEVHDHDLYLPPGVEHFDVRPLGPDRWGPGAVCRWRNIRIRLIDSEQSGEPA
jgi:hypothetical protein